MRLSLKNIAGVFLSWSVVASAMAQQPTTFDSASLTTTLEQLRIDNEAVGFAIGVIDDGELICAKGFGEKALGGGAPVTSESVFHWASVSKPLVATAMMQLAEQGALDLDAKLVDILPDYEITEDGQRDITLRQILLHTAGMPDVDDYNWDEPEYDDRALQKWVLTAAPRALLFEPGTQRKYSNVGFETLGAVIERVSGISFERYMTENIFEPLGMVNATFYYPDVPAALRTQGHAGKAGAKSAVADYPYNRRHGPSSTLNANIDDMARYALALLEGGAVDDTRILKSDTLADMWTPRWTTRETPYRAATMGWVHEDRNGRPMLRHFGWDDGFRSALIIFPEQKQAVFFVTNDEGGPFSGVLRAALAALPAEE